MSQNRQTLAPVFLGLLLSAAMFQTPTVAQQSAKAQREVKSEQNLAREVRHQLVLLPYYSVFDNLAYKVDGDRVTLEGQVTRPTTGP